MHMNTDTYVCVHVHTCICMCVLVRADQRTTLGVIPSGAFHLVFVVVETQSAPGTWCLPCRMGWWARLQRVSSFHFPIAWVTSTYCPAQQVYLGPGDKTQVLTPMQLALYRLSHLLQA